MFDEFDPYYQWLGISPKNQPPDHYRLLGIEMFEANPDVIATAADQRMAHVRSFQSGPRANLSQRILNELSAARATLLDPVKKAKYDVALRTRVSAQQLAPPPPPAAEPAAQFGQRLEPSAVAQPGSDDDDDGYAVVEPTPEPEKKVEAPTERVEPFARRDRSESARSAEREESEHDDLSGADLLANLRDASRLAALEAAKMRLNKLQLPPAYQALGQFLYREGHFRQELAEEFGALDQLGGEPADEADKKAAAKAERRRVSLERALGVAAWSQYGAASAPPLVTAKLRELTEELARLEADIAKTEGATPGRLVSPRVLAIGGVSALAAIVLLLVGVSLRYVLLLLVAVGMYVAYRQFMRSRK